MALYLPIRAFNRSQQVRIGSQKIRPDATTYIDVSDIQVRKEFGYHSAIGAVVVVGGASASNENVRAYRGSNVTEGASSSDRSVRVLAGELRKEDGTYVTVAQQDVTITPGHATLVRIDSVVVNKTTGVASVVEGIPSATPVAPTILATTIRLANVNVVPVSGPGGTNEQQQLVVDANAGTYTLTFDTEVTATINFNADPTTGAGSVRAKLEALSNIGPGDVIVSGGPGNAGGTTPYTIIFAGALAETDVVQLTADATLLTGGAASATISTTTPGASAGIANASITDTRPRN